jgi:hypothetical protein
MHFELEGGTDSDSGQEWIMWVKTAETSVEPPSSVAIEMAISKLINRKEIGHDQILPKMIKESGKELKKVIYELI